MKIKTPFYRNILVNLLQTAEFGSLKLITPDHEEITFTGDKKGPSVDMTLHNWSVISTALKRGDIGFGEDYINGLWTTSDLPQLMTYFVMNLKAVDKLSHGNWWRRPLFSFINTFFRANNRKGSLNNIKSHYDVGNDFYKLWLDESMTYSSAIFDERAHSLQKAQIAKYKRILEKVEQNNSHILEIGCGWGGFAEQAALAKHHITGLTLSQEQFKYANKRLENKELNDYANLKLQDYRDVNGLFDYIVSIEMFEAVGEKYWPIYFQTIKQRLKNSGKAIIQTITIADEFFKDYRKRSDFIRHYTFPGGMLPSLERLEQELSNAGLSCKEVFRFGQDYAKTLQLWLERIENKSEEIKALGYSDRFLRSWKFYLCTCIGSFTANRTDVMQLEIVHAE